MFPYGLAQPAAKKTITPPRPPDTLNVTRCVIVPGVFSYRTATTAAPPTLASEPFTTRFVKFTAPDTFSTNICTAAASPFRSVALVFKPPEGGTSVASDELPDTTPCSVTGLLMVTCSGYVPGHTCTIVGAGVELSAS